MKTMKLLSIAGLATLLLAIGMLQVGCDSTQDGDSIEITPNNLLVSDERPVTLIARSRVDLAQQDTSAANNAGQSLQATVAEGTSVTNSNLVLPLVWTVSSPELGNVASSAGQTAVYVPILNAEGTQIITVRDQGESTGIATIYQK